MTYLKKLIEVALPLEAITEASATPSLRAKRSNPQRGAKEIASPLRGSQ
jgi:hypothetical protein